MPLMPKRTKYRKLQKGRMRGKATRGNKVTYSAIKKLRQLPQNAEYLRDFLFC